MRTETVTTLAVLLATALLSLAIGLYYARTTIATQRRELVRLHRTIRVQRMSLIQLTDAYLTRAEVRHGLLPQPAAQGTGPKPK